MGSLVIVAVVLLAVTCVSLVMLLSRSAQRPPQDDPAWDAWWAARCATLAEAEARAEALLVAHRAPAQRAQLQWEDALDIPSPHLPGRVYCIPRRRGMVAVYEAGRLRWWLCVGPAVWVPDADVVLTHKLMIEGDELAYLRVANSFPATRGQPAHVTTRPRRWGPSPDRQARRPGSGGGV